MNTLVRPIFTAVLLCTSLFAQTGRAQSWVEPHHRLALAGTVQKPVAAITLDA